MGTAEYSRVTGGSRSVCSTRPEFQQCLLHAYERVTASAYRRPEVSDRPRAGRATHTCLLTPRVTAARGDTPMTRTEHRVHPGRARRAVMLHMSNMGRAGPVARRSPGRWRSARDLAACCDSDTIELPDFVSPWRLTDADDSANPIAYSGRPGAKQRPGVRASFRALPVATCPWWADPCVGWPAVPACRETRNAAQRWLPRQPATAEPRTAWDEGAHFDSGQSWGRPRPPGGRGPVVRQNPAAGLQLFLIATSSRGRGATPAGPGGIRTCQKPAWFEGPGVPPGRVSRVPTTPPPHPG